MTQHSPPGQGLPVVWGFPTKNWKCAVGGRLDQAWAHQPGLLPGASLGEKTVPGDFHLRYLLLALLPLQLIRTEKAQGCSRHGVTPLSLLQRDLLFTWLFKPLLS